MRTGSYTGPSPGWTARWPALLLAAIGSIALCASSCRSLEGSATSRQTQQSLTESRSAHTLLAATREAVPPSRVAMRLTQNQLTSLPQGAAYTARSGQARAEVRRTHTDTLEVTATCDSLQREVLLLMQAVDSLRQSQRTDTVLVQRGESNRQRDSPTGWQWFQIWTGRIALLAAAVLIVFKRSKNRIKTSKKS